MKNKKLKMRKQVEKAKATKKKILAQRQHNHLKNKAQDEQDRMQKQFQEVLIPYRKNHIQHTGATPYEPVEDPTKVAAIKKRLEHNMKIIEALEQEMLQEEEKRKNLQAEIAAAGITDMDGQMKFIASKIEEQIAAEE